MSNEIVISISGDSEPVTKSSQKNTAKSTSSSNKNSSDTTSPVHVWDATTGSKLMNFRGCSGVRNGLAVVGGPGCAYKTSTTANPNSTVGCDYFLVSQSDRKAINAWSWGRSQPHFKCAMPEAIGPMCVSKSGIFCFAGGESGRIFVWDLATGQLLRTANAHFKRITKICETKDGAYLITAADDAVIHVWDMVDLVANDGHKDAKSVRAAFSWTEHTLPVTDIFCNIGGVHGHLWSVSMDHTCKVWSISRRNLLHTISFPTYCSSVVTDVEERRLYVGGGDGNIYVTHVREIKNSSNGINANGKNSRRALQAHHGRVNCLAMTIDSTRLISGGVDGIIVVWDARSCVSLKRLDMHLGPITSLLTLIRPSDLLLSKTQSMDQPGVTSTRKKGKKKLRPLQPLQKHSGGGSFDSTQGPIFLSSLPFVEKNVLKCSDLRLIDASFDHPGSSNTGGGTPLGGVAGVSQGDDSIKALPTDSEEVRELKLKVETLVNEKLRWQTVAKELQDMLQDEALRKQDEDVLALPPKRIATDEAGRNKARKKGRTKR